MDLQDFKDHCGLRQALESHAAGLAAANHTNSELEEIERALQAMRDVFATLKKRKDYDEYQAEMAKEDVRFHMAIMTAAKNALLKSEILRLHLIDRVVAGVSPMYALAVEGAINLKKRDARTIAEHTDIFKGIETKNVAKAKAAMEHHMQDNIDQCIKKMRLEEASRVGSEFGI
jgi:DNA-binding GntR family transcriptional regulator